MNIIISNQHGIDAIPWHSIANIQTIASQLVQLTLNQGAAFAMEHGRHYWISGESADRLLQAIMLGEPNAFVRPEEFHLKQPKFVGMAIVLAA